MKLLNCINVLWTLLLLQKINATIIAGDGVEISEILELKLIVLMFFASGVFLDSIT